MTRSKSKLSSSWLYCRDLTYNNWRAPWKGGVCTYFVAIFQVARNPLKFGMPTLLVLKRSMLFFQEGRKIWTNMCENPPPPPPLLSLSLSLSPNIVGFRSLRTKTLCMCVCYGIGGGRDFQECLRPRFPTCGKKTWTFFNIERVGMPNFSGFWATWKLATK